MDERRKKKLAKAGFLVGTPQDLVGATDEEAELAKIKVQFAVAIRELRKRKKWNQTQLAHRMGSDQSRIAKLEHCDGSLELMVRALLTLGASSKKIARTVAASS